MNSAAAVSVPVVYGGSFSLVPQELTGLDDFDYLGSVRQMLRGFQGDKDGIEPMLIEFHRRAVPFGDLSGYVGGRIGEEADGSFSRHTVFAGNPVFYFDFDRKISLFDGHPGYHHVTIVMRNQVF